MTKFKKVLIVFLWCFILGNSLFINTANCDSQKLKKVKCYYQPAMSLAPLVIAYEEGFFKDQGIDLEFVKARDTAEALILLIQNSIDVISGPPTAGMFNAVKNNKVIKLTAGMAYYTKEDTSAGIAITKNKGYKSADVKSLLDGLKGKKIGIPIIGSLADYLIETLLTRNGMIPKDIDLAAMDFPTIVMAMQKDMVSGGFLIEPFITRLSGFKEISVIYFGQEFNDTPFSFIIYGDTLVNKNPELGLKFMIAYLRGCKQYRQGATKRNMEIMKKYFSLDEDTLKTMRWPFVDPEGLFKSKVLEDYQDWLIRKKYIDEKVNVGLMIDTSFLEKGKKILHEAGDSK